MKVRSVKMHFFLFANFIDGLVNFVGIKKDENRIIVYARAGQQITFVMKICIIVAAATAIAQVSPFLLVAYLWCMGKYTLNSWFFCYPIW